MAQHDFVIDNASGSAVRADINNVLSAIVTNNSGATEPTTTFAYQWWADTTSGNLKIRNGANSAWITIGALGTANLGLMLASYFPNVNSNITSSDEELNKLDGCTATTTELNLLAGKTSLTSLSDVYPVGSVYINASNSANPSSIFGFGTWVAIGTGQVLVGLDSGDADFNTAGGTGGSKTDSHPLTTAEMPIHKHKSNFIRDNWDNATNYPDGTVAQGRSGYNGAAHHEGVSSKRAYTDNQGSGNAHTHDIVQPYVVVYMWKRTA